MLDLHSFDPSTKENILDWLNSSIDETTKQEIRELIQKEPDTTTNSFYKKLEFGTGGLRGIMGPGPNRMNLYTIRMATAALADHVKATFPDQQTFVFIGFDNRINSKAFAAEAAKTLAAAGIKAYLNEELRPTPYVSFATRHFKCQAGIMITASHNPPQYNGYKVYWEDGGQVLPPHDIAIAERFDQMTDPGLIPTVASLDHPLIELIGDELDPIYLDKVSILQGTPKQNLDDGSMLKVIYTSLHGTGSTLVPPLLKKWGFSDLHLVPGQCIPDGLFPTVSYPNPEEKEALQLGINLMLEQKADLLIATDPDADRVGVAYLHQQEALLLSGNAIACILLEHILNDLQQKNALPKKSFVVKSVVTTELFNRIAKNYGVLCEEVLPGFKYVAEKIRESEAANGPQFIFGAEESYGYLRGTFSRDKDAVLSSALLSETALNLKLAGKTFKDALDYLYEKYGIFLEAPFTLHFPEGKQGADQIRRLLDQLKTDPPLEIAGQPILSFASYTDSVRTHFDNGKKETLLFPKTSMFEIKFAGGSTIFIRPSGTEPKLKTYLMIEKPFETTVREGLKRAKEEADQFKAALARYFI